LTFLEETIMLLLTKIEHSVKKLTHYITLISDMNYGYVRQVF